MVRRRITWRRRLWAGLASATLATTAIGAEPLAADVFVTFQLKETAGLRRFGYPVHAVLPDPNSGPNFRLERGGKAVPAQFRKAQGPDGRPAVTLDFNSSPGPLESETYTVRSGEGVEPGPEPKKGMTVSHEGGAYKVANGSSLVYEVPEALGGFLNSVRNGRQEFIRPGRASPGLFLHSRSNDKQVVIGATGEMKGEVIRDGPLAIGLRFKGGVKVGGTAVPTVVDMTFPNSKSWVEVRCEVDDPEGRVAIVGCDLRLLIEGEPTLVDFGAAGTVYAQMRGQDWMSFTSGRQPGEPEPEAAWSISKVVGGSAVPGPLFARATSPNGPPAEGWAHVMDQKRCTAAAVAGFGSKTYDQIKVGFEHYEFEKDSPGRLELNRWFSRIGTGAEPVPGPKVLKFWLHFVPTPVQVGAATSPQAMLAPLDVVWEHPRR